jgi:hypothetical protein
MIDIRLLILTNSLGKNPVGKNPVGTKKSNIREQLLIRFSRFLYTHRQVLYTHTQVLYFIIA